MREKVRSGLVSTIPKYFSRKGNAELKHNIQQYNPTGKPNLDGSINLKAYHILRDKDISSMWFS